MSLKFYSKSICDLLQEFEISWVMAPLFFIIHTSPFTQPMVLRHAQMNYTPIIPNWMSCYWVSWWIEGENGEMSDGGMAVWLCPWTKNRGRKAITPANTSIHHISCLTFFRVIISGCMLWPFVSFRHQLNGAIWWALAERRLDLLSLGKAYMYVIKLSFVFRTPLLSGWCSSIFFFSIPTSSLLLFFLQCFPHCTWLYLHESLLVTQWNLHTTTFIWFSFHWSSCIYSKWIVSGYKGIPKIPHDLSTSGYESPNTPFHQTPVLFCLVSSKLHNAVHFQNVVAHTVHIILHSTMGKMDCLSNGLIVFL